MERSETAIERQNVWLRGLVMLLFAIMLGVGQWLLNLLALAQFLWLLFTSRANPHLAAFGRSLAQWLADVARFQACDTDERPFPWAPWPQGA